MKIQTDGCTTDRQTDGWTDEPMDRRTHGQPTGNHNTPLLLCGGV